jgi:hypothetical protein
VRFAATYCVQRDPGRIDNNTILVELEATDLQHAHELCAVRGLTFLMPLLPPFGIDRSKDNGHG